jgi:hypothetical protein
MATLHAYVIPLSYEGCSISKVPKVIQITREVTTTLNVAQLLD